MGRIEMHHRFWPTVPALLVLVLTVAACGPGTVTPTPEEPVAEANQAEPVKESYVWNQLLNRDTILPIYEPRFVPAAQAGYGDDELVMGVAIKGEAKAYPVGPLNSREMVNDELGGVPILVTW
jgi:hypothetical protein